MMTHLFAALARATCHGLASGALTGLAIGIVAYLRALVHVRNLAQPEADSIMCPAGNALFLLPVAGGLLGVLIGLTFGLLFIAAKTLGFPKKRLP